MNNQDQDPLGDQLQGKRAWFGPKLYGGIGYGPRTWQGYLVTLLLAAFVVVTATVTKGHHPSLILLAVVPVIAIPLIIMLIQRRYLGRR
jgi:peptidoglycan/LPS O-acetylase OafA/YrhL